MRAVPDEVSQVPESCGGRDTQEPPSSYCQTDRQEQGADDSDQEEHAKHRGHALIMPDRAPSGDRRAAVLYGRAEQCAQGGLLHTRINGADDAPISRATGARLQ